MITLSTADLFASFFSFFALGAFFGLIVYILKLIIADFENLIGSVKRLLNIEYNSTRDLIEGYEMQGLKKPSNYLLAPLILFLGIAYCILSFVCLDGVLRALPFISLCFGFIVVSRLLKIIPEKIIERLLNLLNFVALVPVFLPINFFRKLIEKKLFPKNKKKAAHNGKVLRHCIIYLTLNILTF